MWLAVILWNFPIADILNSRMPYTAKKLSPKCEIFLKLPPNSGYLSITDYFFKTRRCPLFRGFTVFTTLIVLIVRKRFAFTFTSYIH